MSLFALLLVVLAGLFHASWNLLLKKSGGGFGVIFLFVCFQFLFYAPLAIGLAIYLDYRPSWGAIGVIAVSGALHAGYSMLLERAYKFGDLSLVYPLSRATGPLITIIVAVALLGEQPGAIALSGALMILAGVFLLTGNPAKLHRDGVLRGVVFALMTGCMIAGYTLWDKQGVAIWLVPPLIFDWGINVFRLISLAPIALKKPQAVVFAWRTQLKSAMAIGILSPLSYILALSAMVFTPVSYVAPAREISILFAAIMGAQLLNEGHSTRRLIAAVAMLLGLVALALG